MPTSHHKSSGARASAPSADRSAPTDQTSIRAVDAPIPAAEAAQAEAAHPGRPREIGGRGGADPTRFGDWEKDGRCIDF
jgi:hypothetical protein